MPRQLLLRVFLPVLLATLVPSLVAADLCGKWNVVWDTEGGIRETSWEISQEGGHLTIKMDKQNFHGTVNELRMVAEGEFHSVEAGYASILKIEGELADGVLKGKASWDVYPMTFKATRAD